MSTSVLIRCEHCGAGLRVASGRLRPGASAPCPKCGRPIQIPGAPAPAAGMEQFQCQICGALLRMRSDRRPPAGATARCPRCQSAVDIPPLPGFSRPAAAPAPPSPAAEPPAPAPAGAFGPPRRGQAPAPPDATDADMLPAGISPAAGAAGEEKGTGPAAEEEPVVEIQGDEEIAPSPPPPPSAPAAAPPSRGPVPSHYPSRAAGPAAFWTVEIGGEMLRPGGVAALRLWARQGKLRPEDKVRRADGPWTLAREVPELASLFPRVRDRGAQAARRTSASDARRGWLAGLLGGAAALLPALALLIFSGEFERLAAAWGVTNLASLCGLCAGILVTGALIGRALAGLQAHYENRGEVANVWSFSGALGVGTVSGLASGLASLGFWPHSSAFSLVAGFAFYGISVALLSLVSYRWLFVQRQV